MFPVDGLILVGAVLVLFAVASSKFSARVGVPVLVVFIGLVSVADVNVPLLAGEDVPLGQAR